MSKRICFYGECMPIPGVPVRDEITAQPKKADPKTEAKLARVVELLEKLVAEDRPAATDVMTAKKSQRRENARRLREQWRFETSEDRVTLPGKYFQDSARLTAFEKSCRDIQAAYADRNPHKQKGPRESRLQYPHKPRQREPWEGRLAAQDSTAQFMTACEQAAEAYAARNPHKRQQG